ncbi:MAG: AI-2E family transporter [Methanosarcinaceae archaeon]|nr:AI-2E family transporter [Methanosarcinaceae archaeon]
MDYNGRFKKIAEATIIFVIIAVIYITKEFVSIILLSIFFAYMLNPAYSYLLRITKNKQLSAFLSILMVFVALGLFVIVIIDPLLTEVSKISESSDEVYLEMTVFFDSIVDRIHIYLPAGASNYTEQISSLISAPASWLIPKAAGVVSEFASNIPIYLVGIAVATMLTYYLLMDGRSGIDAALGLLPEKKIIWYFLNELNLIYHSLFNVYFITCILTGIIAVAGFFSLGVPYPIAWGMVTAIFALLPIMGPGTVYYPMALYYFLLSDYTTALILIIFGTVFLDVIPSNLIRPRLAMKGASIHPVITLLSFTAPLFVIGPIGIIVGPSLYGFLLAAYRTQVNISVNSELINEKRDDIDGEDMAIENAVDI